MVSSVLGKRLRLSKEEKLAPTSNITLVKRQCRSRPGQPNNENDDPFLVIDSDEENDIGRSSSTINDHLFTPAKHGRVTGRIERSARKINTQFKTSKVSTSIPVDDPIKPPRTPQTPRHRDALSKAQPPLTPRHRVSVVGRPATPRTPRTPRTPSSSHASLPTVYNAARQLFARSADPGELIGRDRERSELTRFVETRISAGTGGCIYISGPPGTGKSALVGEVTARLTKMESVRVSKVNCMSLQTPNDIYRRLVQDIPLSDAALHLVGCDELAMLERRFITEDDQGTVYVVALDEIDHLLDLDLEALYTLFGWSMQRHSRLILIGVANALDLTDRFLPRLKARNVKPQLLPFLPYTAPQIESVLTTRLRSLLPKDATSSAKYVPFMHPTAISLCARKVASQTGDLRRAFEMSRRAIDVVETETKQKILDRVREQELLTSPSKGPLTDNTNLSSPPKATTSVSSYTLALSALMSETAPRATVAHLARIASQSCNHGTTQRLSSLNLQQKAALCALVAVERQKRAAMANVMATPSKSDRAAPTLRLLYEIYAGLCRQDGLLCPLTSTEFRDVVGSLETLSLVQWVEAGKGSFGGPTNLTPSKKRRLGLGSDENRVASNVGEGELESAIEGVGSGILKTILRGESLD